MGSAPPVLVWFRQDLRLTDNPAFRAAADSGRPIVCLFILEDEDAGAWAHGGASRWWLHQSLTSLQADLSKLGLNLVLRRGPAERVLAEVIEESGATAIQWNRCYEPWRIARDKTIKTALQDNGVEVTSHNAALLQEPWTVRTQGGHPFKVYSPFWKTLRQMPVPAPLPKPAEVKAAPALKSDDLATWALLPRNPDWARAFPAHWTPGEAGAVEKLERFLEDALKGYGNDRNRPDKPSTSRLSPHLHWGEIGPRQIWHRTLAHIEAHGGGDKDAWKFLSEVGWREFSYHLLYHWPNLPEQNWRSQFDDFPWKDDEALYEAWCRGRTGYPIVDAGMRELWATGWMHNRVRMITASFLIKDLLVPWQRGEAWFWDTLVDADLANNAASWQWVAGSGADAAPYFRIFNPVSQGEKFDPKGDYVRAWVPELAELPDEVLHQPWTASEDQLRAAGVTLGESYPHPIVDHKEARKLALDAFETIKRKAA